MNTTPDDDDAGSTVRLSRGYTQVPNAILRADITPTAFKVYVAIRSFGRGAEPTSFPKRATVCERFHISPRAFSMALKELEDLGVIVVGVREYNGKMRRAHTYYFPDLDEPTSEKPTVENLPLQGANFALRGSGDFALRDGALFARPEEEDSSTKKTPPEELPRKRGTTTIPKGWHPADTTLSWAKEKHPRLDVSRETVKFINHHVAKGSRFKDWEQAFRNWLDRAAEWSGPTPIRPTAVQPTTTTTLDPYGDPRWA